MSEQVTKLLYLNHIGHRRDKPGVAVEFHVSTQNPLSPQIYERIAAVIIAVDKAFDAIPEGES